MRCWLRGVACAQVDDLFAYFRFLRYAPYNEPTGFKELIKDKIAANPAHGYKMLQVVLQVGRGARKAAAGAVRGTQTHRHAAPLHVGHAPAALAAQARLPPCTAHRVLPRCRPSSCAAPRPARCMASPS